MLDREDLIGRLFFPSKDDGSASRDAEDFMLEVPDAQLHLRIHRGPPDAPITLLFHGNGEIVKDWDPAAGTFLRHGHRLAVVDYRGYGRSTGHPTLRRFFADAPLVLDFVAAHSSVPLVVMGRSLGSACAWEACSRSKLGPRLRGIVIDSGFVDVDAFARRRGIEPETLSVEDRIAIDPLPKMERLEGPVLLLHGELDKAIVIEEAERAYEALRCDKRLVRLAGKGHNDLSYHPDYWSELGAFLRSVHSH